MLWSLCSLLASSNSFQFFWTQLSNEHQPPRIQFSERPIYAPEWEVIIRLAALQGLTAPCHSGLLGHHHLSGISAPWSVSHSLCTDRLFWLEFFPHLTWHQYCAHLTNESAGQLWFVGLGMLWWVCFVVLNHYFNQFLRISVPLNAWPHKDSFFKLIFNVMCGTAVLPRGRDAPLGWGDLTPRC